MNRTIERRHDTADARRGAEETSAIAPRRDAASAHGRTGAAAEVRCECGSLMARLVGDRIELKCRRCKRVVVVATDRASRGWVTVSDGGCGP